MRRYMNIGLMWVVLLVLAGCGSVFAEQLAADDSTAGIPNLVGHWVIEAKGGMFEKEDQPGDFTHHEGKFSSITGYADITEQEGRVIHGEFSFDKGLNETLIGVIGFDNKTVRIADMDGITECEIISEDLIHSIYSHVTDHDSAVGVGTWTRVR